MSVNTTREKVEPGEVSSMRAIVEDLLSKGQRDEAIKVLFEALGLMAKEQRHLQLLVEKLRWKNSRRSTERIDPDQLRLLFEEFEEATEEDSSSSFEDEVAEDEELNAEIAKAKKSSSPKKAVRKKRVVRTVVHEVEADSQAIVCTSCGKPRVRIGEDTTKRLRYEPGHFVCDEFHLAKYACPDCKDGVTRAPAPLQVLERSMATPSALSKLVVGKYLDHQPLTRLHRLWKREGATIQVSTMSDWVMKTAELVEGVVENLAKRVLKAHVVKTDATGLRVLDASAPDHVLMGTIWCYVGDDRDVVFRYTETGKGEEGPWSFLEGHEGYVQADGAIVFDRLFNGKVADCIRVGCWAHARRKLVELKGADCRVAYPLKLIARMYRLETLADAKKFTPGERRRLRQERTGPVLVKLKRWAVIALKREPPDTQFSKAVGYMVNQWESLERFLEDGRLSLDNNVCESQLRDIALGRKNYLFAGSHRGARAAATFYSLMRTCRQWDVNASAYMTDLLTKIAEGWPYPRLAELLPDRWAEENGSGNTKPEPPAPSPSD